MSGVSPRDLHIFILSMNLFGFHPPFHPGDCLGRCTRVRVSKRGRDVPRFFGLKYEQREGRASGEGARVRLRMLFDLDRNYGGQPFRDMHWREFSRTHSKFPKLVTKSRSKIIQTPQKKQKISNDLNWNTNSQTLLCSQPMWIFNFYLKFLQITVRIHFNSLSSLFPQLQALKNGWIVPGIGAVCPAPLVNTITKKLLKIAF